MDDFVLAGLAPERWWFIRTKLIHDLARQNKMELLLWDVWGLMEKEPTAEALRLLDGVAEHTQAGDATFSELLALYECETALKVPPVVTNFSPAVASYEVTL